ncbi:MAG: hypothetical protein JST27_07710 [Bacteroidetes bacterium]|nr:hypothetical protein [Bacteroidota bacterium]
MAVFLLLTNEAKAQGAVAPEDLKVLQQLEDSMSLEADSMYSAFLFDTRIVYSERFARQLVRALKIPNSWSYPFPRVSQKIEILNSPDGAFRIFNWDVIPGVKQRRYYGAIQLASEKLKLFGLVDYSSELGKGLEDTILTGGKWFGCLYYRIIPETRSDGQKIYTLFGLNTNAFLSNRKVLEPLQLTEQGPVFGAPIFNVRSEARPSERVNRFILEYKKQVQVGMNWDADNERIYFDQLVSQVNDPHRKYTYVPSGEMDGFKWNGDSWSYLQDIVKIVPRKDGEAPINEPQQ